MKKQVLFILPHGTESRLTDDGWVFGSAAPMPQRVLQKIVDHFVVPLAEHYLGILKYQSENMEIHAVFGDGGGVSEISVRSDTDSLSQRLQALLADEAVEILDPETALS